MQRTGYKRIWIGSSAPTGSHRQDRDERIMTDDLWWDTANQALKRLSAESPPTWVAVDMLVTSIILTSANGTKYKLGVENNGALTTIPA